MARPDVIAQLADLIVSVECPHPVRVAIDGVDAAGKTVLADELVSPIENLGRPVIRASVDDFHRPKSERYRRGSDSPEGFYYDSYDYDSFREELLEQLGPGGSLRYRTATFDLDEDVFIYQSLQTAEPNSILLLDGIFLLRPELNGLWDFRIFVHVDFGVAEERDLQRQRDMLGTDEGLRERRQVRYIPGQQIYLDTVQPHKMADVVLDNNDLDKPILIWDDSASRPYN